MKNIKSLLILVILILISCKDNKKNNSIDSTNNCNTEFYEKCSTVTNTSGKVLHLGTPEIFIKGVNKTRGELSVRSNITDDFNGYFFYFNIYSDTFRFNISNISNIEIHIFNRDGELLKLKNEGTAGRTQYYCTINENSTKEKYFLKSTLIKKIEIFDSSNGKIVYSKILTFRESIRVKELFNCVFQAKEMLHFK